MPPLQAAVELNNSPNVFNTIALECCGFVFLGTPHRGSSDANVGDLQLALAGVLTLGGINKDLTRMLAPNSKDFRTALRAWQTFYWNVSPPIACFAEQNPTKLPPVSRAKKFRSKAKVCCSYC